MTLLKNKLIGKRVILASHSPRRRQLLAECGLEFDIADGYDIEEVYPNDLPLDKVAEYLSKLKSEGYPKELSAEDILITADTVVICADQILGKPIDRQNAVEMLTLLSGKTHRVITGVAIRSAQKTHSFSSVSDVTFREVTNEEIEHYVSSCKPFDKAGAYGIQEWIGYVAIEKIEGSFHNVMGLPIQALYVELNNFLI